MGDDGRTEELVEAIRAVRERVRARHPQGVSGGIALIDLLGIVHARDAAEAKVAAIGSVNPRGPGAINALIQSAKRFIARLLDWHVRDQIEFNRGVLGTVEATLAALNDVNRAIAHIGTRLEELAALGREAEELKDIRSHWPEWRKEWERKLSINEVQFLRNVAELETAFQHRVSLLDTAFQHRVSLMESNFRDCAAAQHRDFTGALERAGTEVQKKLWADLDGIRTEYERLIHTELRQVRQRMNVPAVSAVASPATSRQFEPPFDPLRFAERFRGPEEVVREGQRFYAGYFEGRSAVVDLGCGRGEFLELMREGGVPARGVDLNAQGIAWCRAKGLEVEQVDLFDYLASLADSSLDGIFSAQVIEHLPPEGVPELVSLASRKLRPDGVIVLETPNPECLAIFATHYYLDPTHVHPVPPQLLVFYLEEAGFGRIELHRRSPAVDSMPSLATLPEEFRSAFFSGLDYAVAGRRL